MTSTTGIARDRDGVKLLIREWQPATAPRAAILMAHGLGEHCGRYEHVGGWFADAGFAVRSWDQCGFGASGGVRGHIERWSKQHDDLEDQIVAVQRSVPGVPVIVYGHSLGALITLGYALDPGRPRPDLLVLSAPALADDLARWKHAVAPILGRVAPRLRIPDGITSEMVTRDPARQAARSNDPLMVPAPTTRFGAAAMVEQARVRSVVSTLDIPTLVIHGLADVVVPPRASEPLATIPGVVRRTYPGVSHELHNEPEGEAIYRGVIEWVEERLAARV